MTNTITRDEAQKLTPTLVAFVESEFDSALWRALDKTVQGIRKGQAVIVAKKDYKTGKVQYVRAKVTSVSAGGPEADGPMVRVGANGVTWRVDGNDSYQPVGK